jgi:hypothetical protein
MEMKVLRLSSRATRRVLAGAGAVAITAGLSGVALAADAITTSSPSPAAATVIKGCYNSTSGALRVITPHSKSCGSERKISWNQAGPAGNGYAFTSTSGLLDKFGGKESDGPVVTKPGTYFVNVTAQLNISSYTTGGAGFCALDLVTSTPSINYIFEDFSAWNYPAAGSDIKGAYPFASSAMIHVSAKQTKYQFALSCFDNSFTTVPVKTGTWLVSPVSATTSATASTGHSTLGPAGFRPKPALKP